MNRLSTSIIVAGLLIVTGSVADEVSKDKPSVELTGRLFDLGWEGPHPRCGDVQYDTLAVYDQVKGAGLPQKVYVVHTCAEGWRFAIGERHRLVVSRNAPETVGILIKGSIDSGNAPIFHARKVNKVHPDVLTPQSIGDFNLGDPGRFAAGLQEAIRTVAQTVDQPQEFSVQIEPDLLDYNLVFHLWHKDAFLPENRNMVGNPGGKCRDVHYNREQKKVVRTLFWQ
jgi:hypothetical protein